jgi:transcriptional regulator with XRE-family HTH domain
MKPVSVSRRRAIAAKQLSQLLNQAAEQGFSQQEIARRAGLPSQYLSDLKCGRRTMTELAARRLAPVFQVHYAWLLGEGEEESSTASFVWLPIVPYPVEGEPRDSPIWKGLGMHVSGQAAAWAAKAVRPYVLQYGRRDVGNRLRWGDLVLISQSDSAKAEIRVVKYRRKLLLARPRPDGWQRTANGELLPLACPVAGHCLGILWSSLRSQTAVRNPE